MKLCRIVTRAAGALIAFSLGLAACGGDGGTGPNGEENKTGGLVLSAPDVLLQQSGRMAIAVVILRAADGVSPVTDVTVEGLPSAFGGRADAAQDREVGYSGPGTRLLLASQRDTAFTGTVGPVMEGTVRARVNGQSVSTRIRLHTGLGEVVSSDSSAGITLRQGESRTIRFRLLRPVSTPVTARLADVPAGLALTPVSMAPGQTHAELTFSASADAPTGLRGNVWVQFYDAQNRGIALLSTNIAVTPRTARPEVRREFRPMGSGRWLMDRRLDATLYTTHEGGVWLNSRPMEGLADIVNVDARGYYVSQNDVGYYAMNAAGEVFSFGFYPTRRLEGIRAVAMVEGNFILEDGSVWTTRSAAANFRTDPRARMRSGEVVPLGTPGVARTLALEEVLLDCCRFETRALLIGEQDGTVRRWDLNSAPVQVAKFSRPVVGIITDADAYVVLLDDGTVWTWGRNTRGLLGDGSVLGTVRAAPAQIPGLTGVTRIHSLSQTGQGVAAVTSAGEVSLWGRAPSPLAVCTDDGMGSAHCLRPTRLPGAAGALGFLAGVFLKPDGYLYYLHEPGTRNPLVHPRIRTTAP
ncbi:MAG TPA: hypothetical protein VE913_25080 [Longimicrobium sp.]|nr:hypothetical protein [Longimicrobium sp.]